MVEAQEPVRGRRVAATLALAAAVAVPAAAGAQKGAAEPPEALEVRTVEASYEVYAEDKTPREARRLAIDRAQAEAVRKAIGTQVQAERQLATIETGEEVVRRFSQVVRTGAAGRVVDYEVLEDVRVERSGRLFHRVRIRATVRPATGRPDPGFRVELRLDAEDRTYVARDRLEESDELIATIEVTEDAHVTLFNVTPDTLQVIWPNPLSEDTFVPAGTSVEFPPPGLRARGLHLRADVPEGEERVTERLVAVATKQEVPFREVPEYRIEGRSLATARASLQALNRWLVDIPLGQRAIASVTYDVVRAGAE